MFPPRFTLRSLSHALALAGFRLLVRHLVRWRLQRAIRREYRRLIQAQRHAHRR